MRKALIFAFVCMITWPLLAQNQKRPVKMVNMRPIIKKYNDFFSKKNKS